MRLLSILPLFVAVKHAYAANCSAISYTTCDDNIVHWYNPGTGEVCDPLNCGGGRAGPFITDRPGCPHYSGTEIYSSTISILSCWPFTTTGEAEATGRSESTGDTESAAPTTGTVSDTGSEAPSTTPAPTSSGDEGDDTTTDEDGEETDSTGDTGAGVHLHGSVLTLAGAAVGARALLS